MKYVKYGIRGQATLSPKYGAKYGDRLRLHQIPIQLRIRSVREAFSGESVACPRIRRIPRIDRRKSRVVELRYFGGLSIEETAEVLRVSADTVKRDFRMARAWLLAELTGKQDSVVS